MSVIDYMQKCNFEDLEYLGLRFEHAAYLITCRDLAVVVEETERSKLEDVRALENTVDWIFSNRPTLTRVCAVIHHHKASDPYIPRLLAQKMQSARRYRRNVAYCVLKCKSRVDLIDSLNAKFNLSIVL